MTWAAIGAAGISAVGGFMSSKAGKTKSPIPINTTKQSEKDRLYAMGNLLYGTSFRRDGNNVGGLEELYTNPENYPDYAPQPFSDINPYESAAIEQLGGFATTAFPDLYQTYAGTAQDMLSGGSGVDTYAQGLRDLLPQLTAAFASGAPSVTAPAIRFNASPQYREGALTPGDVGAWAPGVDPTTTVDPNQALSRMLSGNIDTQGLQGAMDSYLQPLMENFNEQILPSLQRADAMSTGGQSSAGALKASQRVLEQIGEGANANAQGLLYQANQDALNRMTQGAGLAQQGRATDQGLGLQAYTTGLQGALAGAGNELDYYRTNLGTGLSYDQLMASIAQANAGNELVAGTTNAGLQQSFLDQLLSGSGLGARSAADADQTMAQFASLMPNVINTGLVGPQALTMAGAGMRSLLDPYAAYASQKANYEANLPYQMGQDWYGILQGMSPTAAQASAQKTGNAGAIGNGIAAGLGSLLTMWPQSQSTTGGAATADIWGGGLGGGQDQIMAGILGG